MPETRLTHEEVLRVAQAMSKRTMLDDDIRELALGSGVLPVAIDDVINRFPNDGSQSFSEFMASEKPKRPHWFPPPEIGHDIDPALIEAALGAKPTLAARAKLRKACEASDGGVALYDKLLTAWGTSPTSLAPGKSPKVTDSTGSEKQESRKKPEASNPWSKAGWNITKQGALIKSIGAEKAGQIAAAAGSKIGATKPHPDLG